MAGPEEYFEVWFRHEVDLAERRWRADLSALDAKSSAEGWYRSGARIKAAIATIGSITQSFADIVISKVSELGLNAATASRVYEEITNLFQRFAAQIPDIVNNSAGMPTPRLEEAVSKLIEQAKSDLDVKLKLAAMVSEKAAPELTVKRRRARPAVDTAKLAAQSLWNDGNYPGDRKSLSRAITKWCKDQSPPRMPPGPSSIDTAIKELREGRAPLPS